jgi:hypothetical protein
MNARSIVQLQPAERLRHELDVHANLGEERVQHGLPGRTGRPQLLSCQRRF